MATRIPLIVVLGVMICAVPIFFWHGNQTSALTPPSPTNPPVTVQPTDQSSTVTQKALQIVGDKLNLPEGHKHLSNYLFSDKQRKRLNEFAHKFKLSPGRQKQLDALEQRAQDDIGLLRQSGYLPQD